MYLKIEILMGIGFECEVNYLGRCLNLYKSVNFFIIESNRLRNNNNFVAVFVFAK